MRITDEEVREFVDQMTPFELLVIGALMGSELSEATTVEEFVREAWEVHGDRVLTARSN